MRLLLDAQLSGRVVGRHLRAHDHDVRSLDEHRELEGIDDPEVLALATAENRILITHNVKDFPDILREWAEADRQHAGCIVIVGIRLNQFKLLLDAIDAVLENSKDQEAWINRAVFASRSG